MQPKILLRIAAGCLVFFVSGHSIGHAHRRNVTDRKAREVLQMMTENKFDMFGQLRSYDENYTGMSLNLIFTLLAFVVLLWIISNNVTTAPKFSGAMLVPMSLCVLAFAITSYLYFFPVPAITSFLAFLLIAVSIVKLKNRSTQ